MHIHNRTRQVALVEQGSVATSLLSRARGLLWRAPLQQGEGLLIQPCNSVHTFMMGFPIDVVFMNAENVIIHLIPDMRAGCVSPIVRHARSVIELPAGTIARSGTHIGDRVEISLL